MLDRAEAIIETIEYLTIASVCPDGTPWNTPVFTNYDSDLNFYWGSDKANQHSKNIAMNPNIFCVLYDSRAKEGTGEGVYLKGKAHILENIDDINDGLQILMRRSSHFGDNPQNYVHSKPRRIFKFIAEKAWMNDGSTKDGEYVDCRQEINLGQLKQKIDL